MTAPDHTNAEVSDERLPWRCVKCDCREFARMDTRHWDGGPWEPGDFVRCVHCKETSYWPRELDRRSITSQASEGAVVAWRIRERPGFPWQFVDYDPARMPNVRGWEHEPLYASPVPKRIERLETLLTQALHVLDQPEIYTIWPVSALRMEITQALQGGRS